ncbi:biotin carboxylase [Allocatelliglobosispora scoriae]|uniref:Biotin carboxylase n=1 Tax=Allocatelliglobosispora scoriae TaxID=643052 RepID=A0A841BFX0_9ACTN|nr:ATP-grasp domain-containing protein [Allocatelliglobosispora scoriae]MBB5867184.1 biotin carboxylase [Allocatelliglobosispora scoriae]
MTAVMVGYAGMLLRVLAGHYPDGSVVVVETPETIERRDLHRVADKVALVDAVIGVPGLDPDAIVAALAGHRGGVPVDRVVPGTEAAVVAAADLARRLGLPGAGVPAALLFRDKLRLREAAELARLHQPDWREVDGPAALAAALPDLGGDRFVLKPSNRAGSEGVSMFDTADDPAEVWQRTAGAVSAGIAYAEPARFLVETRLTGPEVSVECLVHEGQVVFTNLTDKHVLPGDHPVEIGHQVRGPLAARSGSALTECMRRLTAVSGLRNGILHGEWILTPQGPALVECAARIPGDRIMELLELAYDGPVAQLYFEIMAGQAPHRIPRSLRGAAIRYLTPQPGTVTGVDGIAQARDLPGVHDVVVDAWPGQRLGPVRASHDRVGHVLATGADADQAWATAGLAAATISIATR